VIVPDEIEDLHRYGVARIYTPEDGARMGLQGMITDMIRTADRTWPPNCRQSRRIVQGQHPRPRRVITGLENTTLSDALQRKLVARAAQKDGVPVLGITGTGGSGKSSLTDELIRRFRIDQADALRIAVIAVDPSRRKTGGALLGRPHPHELDQPPEHLHAFAGHARRGQ